MAAPIQAVPTNDPIPVVQDPPNRGASRPLGFCGRSITNCCAHTTFIAGYGIATCLLGLSIWNQSLVIGTLAGGVAVPITITHVCWSRYSNVANAAEDVEDAARGAKEAAARVQTAVAGIIKISGDVSKAASLTDQAAGHIQVVVDGAHVDSLEASVASYKESSEVLTRQNVLLKEQLEELKGTLIPIMGLVASFRSSLGQLKVGIKAASPLLASFTSMEERLDRVALSLQSQIGATCTSIQSTIEEAAQISIVFMQVIEQKNRVLLDELQEVNKHLQTATAQVAQLSEHIAEGDLAREALLARLAQQQRDNIALKEDLEKTLKAIDTQRRGYEQEAAAGVGSSPMRGAVAEQIAMIKRLTEIMQEIKTRLPEPLAMGST